MTGGGVGGGSPPPLRLPPGCSRRASPSGGPPSPWPWPPPPKGAAAGPRLLSLAVTKNALVYQEVVVEDAPRAVVVLVGPLDVVRAEVVAVDALGGIGVVRLKVTRLLLQIVLSEVENTVAGLDFQLTSMGFTSAAFFLLLHLP